MSLGVMSKAFGLAGLRIGWIATRDSDLRARLARLKDYTTICNAGPSEVLALIALRARRQVLERNLGIVRSNLALLDTFFARNADTLQWIRPRAGSVCFPRLIGGDVEALTKSLVEREGVLLAPGSRFGYAGNYFRLGYGRRDMPAALERFEAFIHG